MNREALNELFELTTFTWETYARAVTSLPPEELTRPLEASGWASLREPLFHLAAGWDGWLSRKAGEILNEFSPEHITTWDQIRDVRAQTRGWIRRILDEMSDAELFEKLEPTHDRPNAMLVSVSTVLTHVLLHERGHHGDITTLLSQAGSTVGNSDYLVYLFFKNRAQPAD